jgi:tetratricopeptide (TPR) repeat protein
MFTSIGLGWGVGSPISRAKLSRLKAPGTGEVCSGRTRHPFWERSKRACVTLRAEEAVSAPHVNPVTVTRPHNVPTADEDSGPDLSRSRNFGSSVKPVASSSTALASDDFGATAAVLSAHPEATATVERPRKPGRARRQQALAQQAREDAEAVIRDVRREIRRRNWPTAERLLRALVDREPTNGRAWLLLAQLYAYRLRDLEKARATFAAALQVNCTNTRLAHAFAMFEARCMQNTDAARSLLDKALKIDPSDGVIWQAYALLEERTGHSERAQELFEAGLARDPRNVFLLQAFGMFHLRNGASVEACAYFERAVESNPSHVPSWQAYGIALSKQGDWEHAAAKFEQALRLDPVSVPTLQAYGIAEARQGHYERARNLFQRAAELWPSHVPVYHAWATMEDRLGNHEEARKVFERGILAAGGRVDDVRRVRSELEGAKRTDPMLKAWADMEQRLGHISPAPEWNVYRSNRSDPETRERRRETIGERLLMLRKLIDRRSEEDLRTVLTFIAERTRMDRQARAAITERSRDDLDRVRRWAERRNEEDVRAFQKWFEKRYEEDRLVGQYVFGWNLGPPLRSTVVSSPSTENTGGGDSASAVPPEWLRAAPMPRPLSEYEKELYSGERELQLVPAMAWISSFAENLSSRAAISTLLLGLMMFLSVGFAHIYELGRYEIGNVESTLLQILSTRVPEGVDAALIDLNPSALDDIAAEHW